MGGELTTKGKATRSRIVEGAAAVLREKGVSSATLDDIMARTSTSKSQLFHYFPAGKDKGSVFKRRKGVSFSGVLDSMVHRGSSPVWSTAVRAPYGPPRFEPRMVYRGSSPVWSTAVRAPYGPPRFEPRMDVLVGECGAMIDRLA
jgi:AcrR family transcriptional regulator